MKRLIIFVFSITISVITYGQAKQQTPNVEQSTHEGQKEISQITESKKNIKTQQYQKRIKKAQMQQRRASMANQKQKAINQRRIHK